MKFARIKNGIVDSISLHRPMVRKEQTSGRGKNRKIEIVKVDEPGWVEVADDVFAGFIANKDGTFSKPADIELQKK